MKRWWLVIALLLSLGVNLGIVGMLLARRAAPRKPPPRPEEQQPITPEAANAPQRVVRLADRLGLEGAPRKKFIALQGRFFAQTVQLRTEMAETQRDLRRELAAEHPDRARIEALLNDSSRTFRSLEQALAQNVLESRDLLDDEQKKEFLRFVALLRPAVAANPSLRQADGPAQQRRLRREAAIRERQRLLDEARGAGVLPDRPGLREQGGPPPQQRQDGRLQDGRPFPRRPPRWWRRQFGGGGAPGRRDAGGAPVPAPAEPPISPTSPTAGETTPPG